MEFKTLKLDNLNLNITKTNKFKCVLFAIAFRRPIRKSEITKQRMLSLLLESSQKYKSKLDIKNKLEDLYGAQLYNWQLRVGTTIETGFSIYGLNENYSEAGILKKYLEFLKEVVFNPNIQEQAFAKEQLNYIKERMKLNIANERTNKNWYSKRQLLLNVDDDKAPFHINMNGYLDEIEKITSRDLYEYYLDVINNDQLDIWLAGDIELEYIKNQVTEVFDINRENKRLEIDLNYMASSKAKAKEVVLKDKIKSSRLHVLYNIEHLSDFEREYVFRILDNILGKVRSGKLKAEIRDKQALCYSINTTYHSYYNLFVISSGISAKNKRRVLKTIDQVITSIINQGVTECELEMGKKHTLSHLHVMPDKLSNILNYHQSIVFYGKDKIDEQIEKIESITNQDIINVAKKLKLHSSLILSEEGELS